MTVTIPWWIPSFALVWVLVGAFGMAAMHLRNVANGYDRLDGLFTHETVVAILAGPVTVLFLAVSIRKDGWVVYDPNDRAHR